MSDSQDLFISHSSADKQEYVEPLAVALTTRGLTFWLDTLEIGWGDNIPLKVNEGLRLSRFMLLCLSKHFLNRPWPEAEMASALAVQNASGKKKILPLILNSKDEVLSRYPLIGASQYREYSAGPKALANELAGLLETKGDTIGRLRVAAESVHTGRLSSLLVNPKASVSWLADKLEGGLGVSKCADTGAHEPFRIRWVLVDVRAENAWNELSRSAQRRLWAVVATEKGPRFGESNRDRLEDLGLYEGIVFHLYPVEDETFPPGVAAAD